MRPNKALISLGMGGFGIGMTEFVIMGILPDVAGALQISIPQAGHFIAAYALGVVVGAPLFTAVGGKWPAHRTLFFLMLWFTVFNGLSASAHNYWMLLSFRFLSGLPHGAFFGIGAVVAGKLAERGKEAQAIATMFAGLTLANVLGVPLGTYLGHNFGWKLSFILVGFIGLSAMASIWFWMPQLSRSSPNGLGKDVRALRNIEVWMVFLLTTIGTGGFFAWYSYIAPLVTEVAGHSADMVGTAMIITGLGMVVGNFLGARLAMRFSPIHTVIITLIFMVIALIANTYFAHFRIGVLLMNFMIGVIAFCIATPIQMTMINSAKGAETLGSALNQSAFNMGNASGAYLAGLPIAYGYGFTSPDWVGAAMAGTGIFIALAILWQRKRRAKVLLENVS